MSTTINANHVPQTGNTCRFDYAAMARDAMRQRDALHRILVRRRAQGPETDGSSRGSFLLWQRENNIIYRMYLEQRSLCIELSRRAAWRGQECPGEEQSGPYLVQKDSGRREGGYAA